MSLDEPIPCASTGRRESIHRVENTTDLPRLFNRVGRALHLSENSHFASTSTSRSEADGCEDEQPLYMKTSTRRKRRAREHSLSEISNHVDRKLDGSAEHKDRDNDEIPCQHRDAARDAAIGELAARIIDKEIYEWQYVCETGRPFWWSREQKSQCWKKLSSRHHDEDFGECLWPTTTYHARRRAMSENYLSDPTNVHTMAHMVAVQLLSSCFTLPLDHDADLPSPNYTYSDRATASEIPDPRMISSLKMHTHFRYSPCFGSQARNSSPESWGAPGDRQFRSESSRGYAGDGEGRAPDTPTPGWRSKRNRRSRGPRVTEDSGHSIDAGIVDDEQFAIDGTSLEKNSEIMSLALPSTSRSLAHGDVYAPGTSQVNCQPPKPSSHYRMQAVLRSEPHHVFIQPVRELVVKRWRTLRRRFGGSLNSHLRSEGSEDQQSETSGASQGSSPALSADGKSRRQRARERGDIHSSADDGPHYNSPVTGCATPDDGAMKKPYRVSSAPCSPDFALADPLSAAAALVAAESGEEQPLTPSTDTSMTCLGSIKEADRSSGSDSAKSPGTVASSEKTAAQPSPSTAKRYSRRGSARRRSMLSEVYNAHDVDEVPIEAKTIGDPGLLERSILSAEGSELDEPMPKQEAPSSTPRRPRQYSHGAESAAHPFSPNTQEHDEEQVRDRPRLRRMSTSGTQIFTPHEEGIEVDGLPVGPGRQTWARRSGRGSTYL